MAMGSRHISCLVQLFWSFVFGTVVLIDETKLLFRQTMRLEAVGEHNPPLRCQLCFTVLYSCHCHCKFRRITEPSCREYFIPVIN